jgi:hypothetical protein
LALTKAGVVNDHSALGRRCGSSVETGFTSRLRKGANISPSHQVVSDDGRALFRWSLLSAALRLLSFSLLSRLLGLVFLPSNAL